MKLPRYLIFWLLLMSVISAAGSDRWPEVLVDGIGSPHTLPGHVIFKLTPEAAAKSSQPDELPESILSLLQAKEVNKPQRVFPAHRSPDVKYHPSGNAFSDLSRIFEVYVLDYERTETVIHALAATGYVEYVQPRFLPLPAIYYAGKTDAGETYVPNDTLVHLQYYLEKISAFEAWAVWKGDTNTVIAIVDTGVELLHSDLVGAIKYNYNDPINGMDSDGDGYADNFYGWDLGEGNNDPSYNKRAHGVHVSGIAAASADNVTGIAGVGFHSKFLPVKIDDEFGRLTRAYEGIVYAADQGAKVINCSWGSFFNAGPFGQDIIDYAVLNHDALVIAAAGNANTSQPFYPASFQRVLSVAATDTLDSKTHFSSFGPFVDIAAPGVGIISTWVNDTYLTSGGTSMAAPVVSGAAAIIRSYYPGLDALETKSLLKMTADPIDDLEANEDYAWQLGYGRLNLHRALTESKHAYITIPEKPWDDEQMGMVRPGQQFEVVAQFVNRLAAADSLYAILTVNSEFLELVEDSVWIGRLGSNEQKNNADNPFVLKALPSMPHNHEAIVTSWFYDGSHNLTGRKSYILTLNLDYINVEAGRIATTISAKGAVGFNYPNRNQGLGLRVDDGYTRLRAAGIIIAKNENSVIDNVYGEEEGSFSESILPYKYPVLFHGEEAAPIIVRGSLRDDPVHQTSPLNLNIDYQAYFWDGDQARDFFILRYTVTNLSNTVNQTLHAGFFADWVMRDIKLHRAGIDTELRLAYAHAEGVNELSGVQLLSFGDMHHYAFDNKGANESIRIDDGFTNEEKFNALTTDRPQAGFFGNDNDVASLVSNGPLALAPLASMEVAFALHVADKLPDMQKNARQAKSVYHELLKSEIEVPLGAFSVHPNPFTDHLFVYLHGGFSGKYELNIYNLLGQAVKRVTLSAQQHEAAYMAVPVSDLRPGIYMLHMEGPNVSSAIRAIKVRKD